jgi:hypothetical protein
MYDDSYEEEEPVTREEMIQCGKNVNAAYALICTDSDPAVPLQVVYVSKAADVNKMEKDCWRSSYYVETIDLR